MGPPKVTVKGREGLGVADEVAYAWRPHLGPVRRDMPPDLKLLMSLGQPNFDGGLQLPEKSPSGRCSVA